MMMMMMKVTIEKTH